MTENFANLDFVGGLGGWENLDIAKKFRSNSFANLDLFYKKLLC